MVEWKGISDFETGPGHAAESSNKGRGKTMPGEMKLVHIS